MILRHLPLVGFVVGRLSTNGKWILGLDREDAMGYGVEGLIQAVDAFDATRGTNFARFAARRIRGAILDAVRRQDPLPRSFRRSIRQVDQAAQELAVQLSRWPTSEELALRLGVSIEAVQEIQQYAVLRFVSLEHVLQAWTNDGGSFRFEPADTDERGDPAAATEHQASLSLLQRAVDRLSERDRLILHLRYSESRPFHEVGQRLGLSESGVCQLHKRILKRILRQLHS